MGSGDSLVTAVRRGGTTAVRDTRATAGSKVWYRVFCVRAANGGYKSVASTAGKSIKVPARKPKPDAGPASLRFEVRRVEGRTKLEWHPYTGKSFVAYKVLRSSGPNPSYLPGTEGTQIIAVISSQSAGSFSDKHVSAGQTWSYRVQAIGYVNGKKVLLAQTAVIAMTVE